MCQKNYNIKNEKKKEVKYKHLNYTERTQIERWYNIDHKSCREIAMLLAKSIRTVQREINRGKVKNLTSELIEIYVYSADVAQQRYNYYIHSKGPELKLGADHELAEYIEKGIKERQDDDGKPKDGKALDLKKLQDWEDRNLEEEGCKLKEWLLKEIDVNAIKSG